MFGTCTNETSIANDQDLWKSDTTSRKTCDASTKPSLWFDPVVTAERALLRTMHLWPERRGKSYINSWKIRTIGLDIC